MLRRPSRVTRPFLVVNGPFWCRAAATVMGYVNTLDTCRTDRSESIEGNSRVKNKVSQLANEMAWSYGCSSAVSAAHPPTLTRHILEFCHVSPTPQIVVILVHLSQPLARLLMVLLPFLPSFLAPMRWPTAILAIVQWPQSLSGFLVRHRTYRDRPYTLCPLSQIGERRLGQRVEEIILREEDLALGFGFRWKRTRL